MQSVLNFSGEDRQAALQFLKSFPEEKKGSKFELYRCRIGESSVTLYSSGKLLVQGKDQAKVKEDILKGVGSRDRLVLGIDETGRGESFGPFVIAAVLGKAKDLRELRDSKKVKDIEGKNALVEEKAVGIAVYSFSSRELVEMHEKGINLNSLEAKAINSMFDLVKEFYPNVQVLVDGSPLKGCRKGISFLVKGDDLNPVVGAASVVAKSIRDNSKDKGERRGWGTWGKKER